jgi:phospholipid/cholesterol/gamma-HCH transport system substrate-binding protein
MIEANRRVSILVGALVLAAIVTVGAVLVFVGSIGDLFARHSVLTACFSDVTGLRPGAAVLISGVRIGSVHEVALGGACGDQAAVGVQLDKGQLARLHADAGAKLVTLGLLGDRALALKPGQATAQLAPGAVLHGEVPADASQVVAQAGEAFDVLVRVARRFETELNEGDVAKMLSHLAHASGSLSRILDDAEHGPGLISMLLHDRGLPRQLRRLEHAVTEVEAASGEAHQTMARLDKGARDASDIVAHIKSGQGTLGGIIYDPAIYEDLRTIVGRVRRSIILRTLARWVIKHQ